MALSIWVLYLYLIQVAMSLATMRKSDTIKHAWLNQKAREAATYKPHHVKRKLNAFAKSVDSYEPAHSE